MMCLKCPASVKASGSSKNANLTKPTKRKRSKHRQFQDQITATGFSLWWNTFPPPWSQRGTVEGCLSPFDCGLREYVGQKRLGISVLWDPCCIYREWTEWQDNDMWSKVFLSRGVGYVIWSFFKPAGCYFVFVGYIHQILLNELSGSLSIIFYLCFSTTEYAAVLKC